MKKVILDSTARFKLERLCDAVHPQECGGVLFGIENAETIWIMDIFPVANVAEDKNRCFKEHNWGNYWRDLYAAIINGKSLGSFHSHPNGSIPSAQDMQAYNDSNLHLWVIHHDRGEHTFQASVGITHLPLELAAMPTREMLSPELTENGFRLGEIQIDEHGRLVTDVLTNKLLKLKEQDRATYLAVLKVKDRVGDFEAKQIAEKLNIGKATASKRLMVLKQAKIIRQGYNRRYWSVERT